MWSAIRERFDGGETVAIEQDGARVSFAAVLEGWRSGGMLADVVLGALAGAPFAAFYWEMPSIVAGDLDRPYEYVTIDAPALRHAREDGAPFGAHLACGGPSAAVTAFPSLGGRAMLVAPLPIGPPGVNAHIATFVRGGPRVQQRALLALVAEEALSRLDARPTWISTSGGGVHWLHVRIERAPTYYTHAPYRGRDVRPDSSLPLMGR